MRSLIFSLLLAGMILVVGAHAHIVPNVYFIEMNESGYYPDELAILQGDVVVFWNKGGVDHWPASDIHPSHTVYPGSNIHKCEHDEERAGIFDACTPVLPGESWNFTFTNAGEWTCHDHIHPEQRCAITVMGDEHYVEEADDFDPKLSLTRRLQISFERFYYQVFPDRLEERLAKADPFMISEKDEELFYWVTLLGPDRAMRWLLDVSGGGSDVDCHQPAHQFGRAAYALYGGKAFEKGDAACHSGYYHGAMERLLTERGTESLAQTINYTCSLFQTNFGYFECLHGVGHGVLAYKGYDLPEAVETCGELYTQFERDSCYGGMFMENIITGLGLGAIPGHETEWLSDDPHFPCNALDSGYSLQMQCYQMQTSWMLRLNRYDFAPLIDICQDAPEALIPVCFRSYGRDAAGHTLRKPERMATLCAAVPEEYRQECHRGALNVIVDFWGAPLEAQAAEYCGVLEDAVEKKMCYATLASRHRGIWGLDTERIERGCSYFEEDYRETCLIIGGVVESDPM